MATESAPTTTALSDNDINNLTLNLTRTNSLTLQIPGGGASNPSSEPSSSSDPPSPNPLLSESNTSTSTAASSNTTIKTSASSDDVSISPEKSVDVKLVGLGDSASAYGGRDDNGTPGLSEDSEQNTRSTASLPTTLSVRFAPLPELAPRKRRSAAPLGMAARKQLMRRRRGLVSDAELDGVGTSGEQLQMSPSYAAANAGWTEEEIEEYRRRQEAIAARQAQNVAYVTAVDARIHEAEVENEEYRRSRRKSHGSGSSSSSSKTERSKSAAASLGKHSGENLVEIDVRRTVFGRIVKGASKTLFKKISNKELASVQHNPQQQLTNSSNNTDDDGDDSADDGPLGLRRQQSDSGLKLSRTSSSHLRRTATPPPPMPLRPILLNGHTHTSVIVPRVIEPQPEQVEAHVEEEEEEEGRVWEEEIGQSFPLNVGQTETFVEGRGIYSRTATVSVDGGSRSRSATPPISASVSSSRPSSLRENTVSATSKAGKRVSTNLVKTNSLNKVHSSLQSAVKS